mgnify:CR=1 FL=1
MSNQTERPWYRQFYPWMLIALPAAAVIGGFVTLAWRGRRVAPPRPAPSATVGRLRDDTPAVVNMLANDATVTAAALRATVIDLAARGWLRVLPPDENHEPTRARPAARGAPAHRSDALQRAADR